MSNKLCLLRLPFAQIRCRPVSDYIRYELIGWRNCKFSIAWYIYQWQSGADPDISFGGHEAPKAPRRVGFEEGVCVPLLNGGEEFSTFGLEIVHFGVYSDTITHAVHKAYRAG